MFSGIGFGAERIGLLALKFPRTAAVCLLALFVMIGFSLPRITFDEDIHRVFLSDSPLSTAQRAYEAEQTEPLSTILIHITSTEKLSADDMKTLRDLSLDLEFLDGVTGVTSPFVLRWSPTEDAGNGVPLFAQQIAENFGDDLSAFEALQTGLPTFVNAARTALLLSVSVATEQVAVADAVTAISTELDRTMPEALSAQITGEDVISAEIVSGLKGDLLSLNMWGALITTLAAAALLRDLRMALIVVLPALAGAAAVLALGVWLGYPVTVLSNVIPILLLVLGVADGVHLAGHLKNGGTTRAAVENVGPACALTALTTSVAFGSVSLTGNAQLFEFAILGAVGTLLSFSVVIVCFALLGQVIPLSNRSIPPISALAATRLTTAGIAAPRISVTVCITLLALCAWGFTQTKAWFPLYQNLPDNSATLNTNDVISQEFGGVFRMIVETNGNWSELRDMVEQLEKASGRGTVLSEVNFARWLGYPDREPNASELTSLPAALVDQLKSDSGASRIFISMPEPMRNTETLALFDTVYQTALAAGADRVIGLPTVMRQEAVTLIGQLSLGLVIASLGATLLVAVAFRSVWLIPVLFIPNVLPLMLTGASLHLWAQGELSPTAVLALTIAFGIAVDDTVHFLSRYFAAKSEGQTNVHATQSAAGSAGEVMVLTTLLLTVGLCVTLFSDFTPIRLFGGMMILTLWAALLIDLLLLPALLTWKAAEDVVA